MAIYTQYGRYLKAKLFKEMLEVHYDTYMALGLGNPRWDLEGDNKQEMPIASYDTTSLLADDQSINQFYDGALCQFFIEDGGAESLVVNGRPRSGSIAEKCKNLNPPFPCIWSTGDESDFYLLDFDGHKVSQNTFHEYSIKNGNLVDVDGQTICEANFNDANTLIPAGSQYYAELYLRGLNDFVNEGIESPCGLLGVVRADISFVKDIGMNYTGDITQLWYGDRYWEIVNPNDEDIDSYIGVDGQTIYPHHLLITAMINPGQLCSNIEIDQNIVPRQIAIYVKDKDADNKVTYKVGDYHFNFGQYTKANIQGMSTSKPFLNFTLPCTAGSREYPNGDFKFLLHDYIHGTPRVPHSVDRIGYIIGF